MSNHSSKMEVEYKFPCRACESIWVIWFSTLEDRLNNEINETNQSSRPTGASNVTCLNVTVVRLSKCSNKLDV